MQNGAASLGQDDDLQLEPPQQWPPPLKPQEVANLIWSLVHLGGHGGADNTVAVIDLKGGGVG